MIVSPRSRMALLGVAFVLLGTACATDAPPPPTDPLEPLPLLPAMLPDDADLAARDAAVALWADDPAGIRSRREQLEDIDRNHQAAGDPVTGLVPFVRDAEIALVPDARERRDLYRELLEVDNLDPALETRLEAEVSDDPLELAERRIRDARIRRWGGYANSLTQSVGRNVANPTVLPLKVAQALVRVGLQAHLEDELSVQERQALQHWKDFTKRHPDAEEASAVLARIEDAQARWLETKRDQSLRQARASLEEGNSHMAAAFAARALRYLPDDPEAAGLRVQALSELERWQVERARSLETTPGRLQRAGEVVELARALWEPGADLGAVANHFLESAPRDERADEARFVLATAAHERGEELVGWQILEELADEDVERSNMSRHARALVQSLDANPYQGFLDANALAQSDRYRWLAFGPLSSGARDRDLPRPVEWLVELPSLAGVLWGLPQRLLQFPFMTAERRSPGVMAYRYLERFPAGAHEQNVQEWLLDYEQRRKNHVGAYRLAAGSTLVDADELAELREAAAAQALEVAEGEERRDVRVRLLRQAARDFKGTVAGHQAGLGVRRELEQFSPQRIRITRGFLEENRAVAGPNGLAIRPAFLDGELANGELHPDGLSLLGGRIVELAFIRERGDKGDAPELVRERISQERLTRVVTQLEESALHAIRTDRDLSREPDAARDTYLERARLGAVDKADLRAEAGSTYTYMGVRERFGAVRGRESILPVELVLQGSFSDFALGAFPRVRLPKSTTDAVLYR